ncbi:hypothetical protein KCU61_g4289, partial [Aureobasidium melanogenum]
VLVPEEFDRSSLKPSAPAVERLSFPSASPVAVLPFTNVAFEGDTMTYTSTPHLLQTIAAVATSRPNANGTSPTPPLTTYTGSAVSLATSAIMVMAVAIGVAALMV